MSSLLGALTTTFTLPSACAESIHNIYGTQPNADFWIFARGPLYSSAGLSCFPSGYKPDRSFYFSPGFCASGYTPAYSSSGIIAGNIEETTVVCCPSVSGERYFYDTRRAPFDYERPYACKWEFKSLTTRITYIGDGTTDSTETTTVTADGGAINAHGYQIRFQATDTLTPSSASLAPITSISLGPTNTSPPGQSAPSSSGLSSGAAAGIGVSVTIVVIALVFAAFYFGRRSIRRKKQAELSSSEQGFHGGTTGDAVNLGGGGQTPYHNGYGQGPNKYYYSGVPIEMGASPTAEELPPTEITRSTLTGDGQQGRDTIRPEGPTGPVELEAR